MCLGRIPATFHERARKREREILKESEKIVTMRDAIPIRDAIPTLRPQKMDMDLNMIYMNNNSTHNMTLTD